MAIFHFTVKCFSRSKGHSAVAAAAYRSGARLTDARTGEIADYTRRAGVVSASLHLPPDAPALDRGQLWDLAEAAEKRKNSTVARECEVALPCELPRDAQVALAQDLAGWLVQRYGVAVDCAVHEPTGENDRRNVHAHLLMSTRVLGPSGFGEKTRILDAAATGSLEVTTWREVWASMCNAALEAHGSAERISHLSNEARGLDAAPTIKVGRSRGAAERRAHNDEVRALNAELAAAIAERAQVAAAEKIEEARALAQRAVEAEAEREHARQVIERAPGARSALLETLRDHDRELTRLREDRKRALPRQLVVEAQNERDDVHASSILAAAALKRAHDELEQRQRWWHYFARRALERQIEQQLEPQARMAMDNWREVRKTASAPVAEDVRDQIEGLEKQREEARSKIDRIERAEAQAKALLAHDSGGLQVEALEDSSQRARRPRPGIH